MNKFDHILVEYDGNIEKPNIKFLEKDNSHNYDTSLKLLDWPQAGHFQF